MLADSAAFSVTACARLCAPPARSEDSLFDLPRYGLTNTEKYVLLLLADGTRAPDIARQVSMRISRIGAHIRNLLGKTRSPSTLQLVRQLNSTHSPETS